MPNFSVSGRSNGPARLPARRQTEHRVTDLARQSGFAEDPLN